MVGLRLPVREIKEKQLTPLGLYTNTYNAPMGERPLLLFRPYCELSKFTICGIKLKRFLFNNKSAAGAAFAKMPACMKMHEAHLMILHSAQTMFAIFRKDSEFLQTSIKSELFFHSSAAKI